MPFYRGLRKDSVTQRVRERACDGIMALKDQFKTESVPPKNVRDSILLATWNIREFDSEKYGARCLESFYYIAEIIDHFDLIAIQEVRGDLSALQKLMSILGSWWKYVVTDVTLGASGNDERLAFLFDTRKVTFNGLAGELVLPRKDEATTVQFARTPFICGFKAGWTEFCICTVHIYYGKSVALDPRRVQEIKDLASTLADIAEGKPRKLRSSVSSRDQRKLTPRQNLIVLGDFNIFNRKDATYEALVQQGFEIPAALRPVEVAGGKAKLKDGSNLDLSKHYDQIAFIAQPDRFEFQNRAGIFNFQKSVFDKGQYERYADLVDAYVKDSGKKPKDMMRLYNDWRTYQMSDHLLMWAEIKIDFAREYLAATKSWKAGG